MSMYKKHPHKQYTYIKVFTILFVCFSCPETKKALFGTQKRDYAKQLSVWNRGSRNKTLAVRRTTHIKYATTYSDIHNTTNHLGEP